MPEIRRKTIAFRSQTPAVDPDTAAEILDHVETYDPPAGLSSRETADEGSSEETVVFADHDPETTDILDADATLITATHDEEAGRVSVQFRASEETLPSSIGLLEHVLDVTTLETGEPPESDQFLDVQIILDGPVEPYQFSPPEGMLFRTKRTPDGQTALRLVIQDAFDLEESGDVVVEEVDRALSLGDQV